MAGGGIAEAEAGDSIELWIHGQHTKQADSILEINVSACAIVLDRYPPKNMLSLGEGAADDAKTGAKNTKVKDFEVFLDSASFRGQRGLEIPRIRKLDNYPGTTGSIFTKLNKPAVVGPTVLPPIVSVVDVLPPGISAKGCIYRLSDVYGKYGAGIIGKKTMSFMGSRSPLLSPIVICFDVQFASLPRICHFESRKEIKTVIKQESITAKTTATKQSITQEDDTKNPAKDIKILGRASPCLEIQGNSLCYSGRDKSYFPYFLQSNAQKWTPIFLKLIVLGLVLMEAKVTCHQSHSQDILESTNVVVPGEESRLLQSRRLAENAASSPSEASAAAAAEETGSTFGDLFGSVEDKKKYFDLDHDGDLSEYEERRQEITLGFQVLFVYLIAVFVMLFIHLFADIRNQFFDLEQERLNEARRIAGIPAGQAFCEEENEVTSMSSSKKKIALYKRRFQYARKRFSFSLGGNSEALTTAGHLVLIVILICSHPGFREAPYTKHFPRLYGVLAFYSFMFVFVFVIVGVNSNILRRVFQKALEKMSHVDDLILEKQSFVMTKIVLQAETVVQHARDSVEHMQEQLKLLSDQKELERRAKIVVGTVGGIVKTYIVDSVVYIIRSVTVKPIEKLRKGFRAEWEMAWGIATDVFEITVYVASIVSKIVLFPFVWLYRCVFKVRDEGSEKAKGVYERLRGGDDDGNRLYCEFESEELFDCALATVGNKQETYFHSSESILAAKSKDFYSSADVEMRAFAGDDGTSSGAKKPLLQDSPTASSGVASAAQERQRLLLSSTSTVGEKNGVKYVHIEPARVLANILNSARYLWTRDVKAENLGDLKLDLIPCSNVSSTTTTGNKTQRASRVSPSPSRIVTAEKMKMKGIQILFPEQGLQYSGRIVDKFVGEGVSATLLSYVGNSFSSRPDHFDPTVTVTRTHFFSKAAGAAPSGGSAADTTISKPGNNSNPLSEPEDKDFLHSNILPYSNSASNLEKKVQTFPVVGSFADHICRSKLEQPTGRLIGTIEYAVHSSGEGATSDASEKKMKFGSPMHLSLWIPEETKTHAEILCQWFLEVYEFLSLTAPTVPVPLPGESNGDIACKNWSPQAISCVDKLFCGFSSAMATTSSGTPHTKNMHLLEQYSHIYISDRSLAEKFLLEGSDVIKRNKKLQEDLQRLRQALSKEQGSSTANANSGATDDVKHFPGFASFFGQKSQYSNAELVTRLKRILVDEENCLDMFHFVIHAPVEHSGIHIPPAESVKYSYRGRDENNNKNSTSQKQEPGQQEEPRYGLLSFFPSGVLRFRHQTDGSGLAVVEDWNSSGDKSKTEIVTNAEGKYFVRINNTGSDGGGCIAFSIPSGDQKKWQVALQQVTSSQ